MGALPTRCFLLQHTKATFVERVKTDVSLALKNVMAKFAEEFSEYTRENDHEPEEGGVFCSCYEILMQPGKLVTRSKKSIISHAKAKIFFDVFCFINIFRISFHFLFRRK